MQGEQREQNDTQTVLQDRPQETVADRIAQAASSRSHNKRAIEDVKQDDSTNIEVSVKTIEEVAKRMRSDDERYQKAIADLTSVHQDLQGEKQIDKALKEQINRGIEYVQSLSTTAGQMHEQVIDSKRQIEKERTEREAERARFRTSYDLSQAQSPN